MSEPDESEKQGNGGVDSRLAHHGHISYLEFPATSIEQSASFYEAAFGWAIDRRDDGRASFDDRSGCLIGRWVTGRSASREAGLLPYIYVQGIDVIVERITKGGGVIVQPVYPESNLWVATFRDPAG